MIIIYFPYLLPIYNCFFKASLVLFIFSTQYGFIFVYDLKEEHVFMVMFMVMVIWLWVWLYGYDYGYMVIVMVICRVIANVLHM